MPIYEYKCKKGHVFEVMQKMSDDALTKCEVCGAPVQRVFHPIAVHFKGSGFYNTDYGTKRRSREAKENESKSSAETAASSESSSNSSSSDAKPAKGDSKASTSSSESKSKSPSSASD